MASYSLEQFERVRARGEELFRKLGTVRCPYFQREVLFNAHGLEHIKFKEHGKARSVQDQYVRFKLLHLAPEILRLSRTVQGIRHTKHFERIRVYSRTDTILVPVSYFEFIAVMRDVRCKVVIKQVRSGALYFWSIIPFWGTHKDSLERKLYTGNLETD